MTWWSCENYIFTDAYWHVTEPIFTFPLSCIHYFVVYYLNSEYMCFTYLNLCEFLSPVCIRVSILSTFLKTCVYLYACRSHSPTMLQMFVCWKYKISFPTLVLWLQLLLLSILAQLHVHTLVRFTIMSLFGNKNVLCRHRYTLTHVHMYALTYRARCVLCAPVLFSLFIVALKCDVLPRFSFSFLCTFTRIHLHCT